MNQFVIEGFDLLTKQDIFNLAVAHISTTRVKSARVLPGQQVAGCFYGGTGCNAAPLIRPECRNAADNSNDHDTGWQDLVCAGVFPPANAVFIGALQKAHDNSPEGDDFMVHWKSYMAELAFAESLDTTELAKVNV